MMGRTVISKQDALLMLRRWGSQRMIEEAERDFPDPIDLRRDEELLARYGMTRNQLVDRAGGSP